jgi:hypothetical protein
MSAKGRKQTCHAAIQRLLTDAKFMMRDMMLIHCDEVALAGGAIALGRLRGGQGELKYSAARFIRLCP